MSDVHGTPAPESAVAEDTHAADYAAAIYGSIIVTAVVGALWDADVSARDMTIQVFATVGVFWLAHSWAAITGEQIHAGRIDRARVAALARAEWPMVEAGFAPLGALVLAWVGLYSDEAGARIAIALGVVQLFAWGFVLGRRMYGRRLLPALLAGLGNGLLGLTLVALEIWVTH